MKKCLLIAVSSAFSISTILASTISVSTSFDSGLGSLREAVSNADPGDTIYIDATDTIKLSTELSIGKNLTITKKSKGEKVISGDGVTRVFSISAGYTLTLSDLTISRGVATNGAGIMATGNLTATNCLFSGNQGEIKGGAISAEAVLTITDCAFEGNSNWNNVNYNTHIPYGGAIHIGSAGVATIDRSTFTGNSCRSASWVFGGAIGNEGTLTITNSTLSGNTLESTNVLYQAAGAGVGSINNTVTMTHCTVINNNIINGANSGAGFGGWQAGTTTLNSNIIYGNTYKTNTASDIKFGQGTTRTSAGYNIIGAVVAGFTTVSTDQVGIDPSSGSLALNGGVTENSAIECVSAAFGKGDPANAGTISQNGISRGTRTDVGSYQWDGTLPSVAITPTHPTCFGETGSAVVDAPNGNYTYSWTGGASGTSISSLPAGNYFGTVTDADGCKDSTSFSIINPNAITFSSVITDDAGGNTGAIDITVIDAVGKNIQYSWSPGNETTQDLTNLAAGTYTVTVTDGNGCVGVEAFAVATATGIISDINQATKVFPNPTNGLVTVDAINAKQLQLFNLSGKQISSTNGNSIDCTGIDAGAYLLKILFDDREEILMIYVQ